jgi:hypothetical protein
VDFHRPRKRNAARASAAFVTLNSPSTASFARSRNLIDWQKARPDTPAMISDNRNVLSGYLFVVATKSAGFFTQGVRDELRDRLARFLAVTTINRSPA